ncbi:MAG: hypothetical protein AB7T49_09240 [Oligoflexales bacterium]
MGQWLNSEAASFIVILLFFFFFVAWEICFRVGSRIAEAPKDKGHPQGQAIEAAILTLFALLLGFTFSMSSDRYEARKQAMVEEANAIDTAYARTALLDPVPMLVAREIIRRYVDSRIDFYDAPEGTIKDQVSERLQRDAWNIVAEESRKKPTSINATVVTALNNMAEARERQLVSYENIVPFAVDAFLLALAVISMGVVGYLNGKAKTRHTSLCFVFAVVVSMTLFLLLDLDRPRKGAIKISHESLLRLREVVNAD